MGIPVRRASCFERNGEAPEDDMFIDDNLIALDGYDTAAGGCALPCNGLPDDSEENEEQPNG